MIRLARTHHQLARDLGLAIDRDAAGGQALEVDAVQAIVKRELGAGVAPAVAVQAVGNAGPLQQLNGGLLQQAGADAAQDVVGRAGLEDDVVDAGFVQQLAQQQAGGAGADDGDPGSHRWGNARRCRIAVSVIDLAPAA
jgi:hypothetical protein